MPVSLNCTCYHELNNRVNKRNQWQKKKMTVEETGCRKSGYFCSHTKPAWSMKSKSFYGENISRVFRTEALLTSIHI